MSIAEDLRIAFLQANLFWQVSCAKSKTKACTEISAWTTNIGFPKCRREIAVSLNDFSNRWCKRESVEPNALKEWKINIFEIIDTRISFYSRNTHFYPLNLNLLFFILNEVSRIFIGTMF